MQYLYIAVMGLLFSFMAVKVVSKFFGSNDSPPSLSQEEIKPEKRTKPSKQDENYKKSASSSKLTKTARPSSKEKIKKPLSPNITNAASEKSYSSSPPEIQALEIKYQALNSTELKKELENIISGSVPPALKEGAVRALVTEWAKKDPSEAIAFLADNPISPTSLNYKAEQEVLKELAKSNPDAAQDVLIDIDQNDESGRSLFLTDYISSVAIGWAQNDPEAAFDWLNDQDFKDGTKAFNKYINEITKVDEDLAFDQINRLSPEKQAEAIKGISAEWGKEENWNTVQNRIDSLPEDIQDEAFRNALIPFSKENPQDAMDLISAIPENNTEKNRIVYQVLDQLGQDNHREKIDWAIQNSTDNYTTHVAGTVLMPWITDNPHGAMQWLSEQPNTTATKTLINRYLNNPAAPDNYKQVLRDKISVPQQ